MTFEEWFKHTAYTDKDCAEDAYEAGIQEGIDRMYRLYDICPECKLPNGQHKMDCGRGRHISLVEED
jgi:hypothetical protein